MTGERQFRYLNLDNAWPDFNQRRGLEINSDGSLTLARVPAFAEVLGEIGIPSRSPAQPAGLSGDSIGNIYLADPANHRVLKLDTCTGTSQPLQCFGGYGNMPGQLNTPRGVLVGPRKALYLADSGNHRIQIVDLRTWQLRGIWGQPATGDPTQGSDQLGRFNEPWGLATDQAGAVYIVERVGRRVQKFSPDGQVQPAFWETLQNEVELETPTDIAIAIENGQEHIYLVDAGRGVVLIIDPEGHLHGQWDLPDEVSSMGIVGANGALYIGDAERGQILQFDLEGDFIGAASGYRGAIAGLALACDGSLLLHPGGGTGVIRMVPDAGFVPQGDFLAGPFEVSEGQTSWHRLRTLAEPLPAEAHVQLFTITNDDQVDPSLGVGDDPFSDWPAAPSDELDILVLNPPARYLWIGGRLQGDGHVSPKLVQMQVSYPPDTYLRYLPAIYSENEQGRLLLERALALFESILGGLSEQTRDLPLLFDQFGTPTGWAPWLAGWQASGDKIDGPTDWLPWLAGWLAFELDEGWTEAQARRAIADAFELYGIRGTLEGLRRMIKLYTGVEVLIEEPARFSSLWSLGERSVLGFDTMLAPAYAQGAVLATTATLDESHLIGDEDYGAPLFESIAHRFCVRVYRADLKQSRTLENIVTVLEREKPAHSEYHLCIIEPRMRVGFQARIGIDTIVAGPPQGLSLDGEQPLGYETVLDQVDDAAGGTIGRQARIGRNTLLT